MNSQFLQFPNQSLLLPQPYFLSPQWKPNCKRNRPGSNLTFLPVHSLISPVKGASLPIIDEVNSFERDSYIARRISKSRVESLVDKIKALISKEGTGDILKAIAKEDDLKTISQFNDLLMTLLLADKPNLALKLFSNLSSYGLLPDVWTFSILIRCFCKNQNPDEATNVLNYMVVQGCHPSVTTITIIINAFCRRGKMQKAFEVFDFISRMGIKPDIQTYNCLLKGLCYVGKVEEACEMLIKIKKDCVEPDIYTYTALMVGLCKVGRSDEAMELLNEAMEMELRPNVVTFNTLFNGYCKEGRPLEGIGVLKKMKEINCKPDYISYSTMLHGLLKWSKVRTALRIYREMLGLGYVADERMMNTLVRLLCRRSCKEADLLEDVHQVLDKMRGEDYVIDHSTFELATQALCIGNKINEGLVNLHHMIERGYTPSSITFDTVISTLCGRGKVDEALLILVQMNECCVTPSRVCFEMLIEECDQGGWGRSSFHVRAAALKQGCCLSDTGIPSSNSSAIRCEQ